jgi:hypothetical protein
MSALPSEDPFVAEVLYLVPPQVASRMTEAERRQFQDALKKGSPRSRHSVDWRFSIPLVYSGLYVVFQVGRDRRRSTGQAYVERRRVARHWLESGGLLVACIVLFVLAAITVYWIKSRAGINVFPNDHLRDFVPVYQNKHWFEGGKQN